MMVITVMVTGGDGAIGMEVIAGIGDWCCY